MSTKPHQPLAVSVVLHDVAPSTWPACETLLNAIDQVAQVPVTLLLVPDHHHRAPVEMAPDFIHAIRQRVARGDEVALHGLHHWDDGPPSRGPREWLTRRVYTASEGEFLALDQAEAQRRLHQGRARLEALGWSPHGFVAPAWLLGSGAWAALRDLRETPFSYTSSRKDIILLPSMTRLAAPSLVFSVRSAWRRQASLIWNTRLLNHVLDHPQRYPLLRLGLHPVDAAHPRVVRFWQHALEAALEHGRVPMTKGDWVNALQRQ